MENPRRLSYEELERITDNFSEERMIGQGGYGKVYMGILHDEEIAVKVLYNYLVIDSDQLFERELYNIWRLRHENIVQLIGYCYQTNHEPTELQGQALFADATYKALCFKFMKNRSLDKYLSGQDVTLNWDKTYKIIKGTCEGLKYLHKECNMFHLDLKPENILLDEDMVPKLGDFGLSRFVRGNQTMMTQTHSGTIGYMPPEYIDDGIISDKYDIFSLGVVIIKMIIRPENYFGCRRYSSEIIERAEARWRNELRGTSLLEEYCKQVKMCIEIALNCVKRDRSERPSIVDIINMMNEMEGSLPSTRGEGSNSSLLVQPQLAQLPEGPEDTTLDENFSLGSTSRANCYMVSSRSLMIGHIMALGCWRWINDVLDSRSVECAELLNVYFLAVTAEIATENLAEGTHYAVYLVYKLGTRTTGLNGVQTSLVRLYGQRTIATHQVTVNPASHRDRATGIAYPVPREDGWMEVKLAEIATDDQLLREQAVMVDFREVDTSNQKRGLIIAGIEFRPNN